MRSLRVCTPEKPHLKVSLELYPTDKIVSQFMWKIVPHRWCWWVETVWSLSWRRCTWHYHVVAHSKSHYEPVATINFLSPKLAISVIDTSSLEPSIKTYTGAILQTKLIRRYRYVQFVTTAFYCMYMRMNFVHSCVWRLFLKNKR